MNLRWTIHRAIVAGAMLGVLVPGPARADEKFSDTTCPAAVPSVVGFTTVANTPPLDPAALLSAAIAAGDAYQVCALQLRTDQRSEPQGHYAQFRAAQYFVVAGRVEIQLGKFDLARKYLGVARQEATDVAGWQPFGTSSATRHSVWADKSKAILAAIDEADKALPTPDSPKPTSTP